MWTVLRCLPSAAWQAWVSFALIAYVGTLTIGLYDGDSLFQSDDPYIIGTVCGIVPAAAAALFSLVWQASKRAWIAHATCVAVLAIWCGGLWPLSPAMGEGAGLGRLMAVVSAGSALLAWPLLGRRIPVPAAVIISIAEIGRWGAWFAVTSRLGLDYGLGA